MNDINFKFPNQTGKYAGKIRDIYFLKNDIMVMITTDKISAFDIVLPKEIPYKGEILNKIAIYFMEKTKHIVKNWILETPHPNIIIGQKCTPFKVEMIVRGYLAGHSWREYKKGNRLLCGVKLPEGLKENDKLLRPIITPSTKAEQGEHDQDISKEDILLKGIVSKEDYKKLENITYKLFEEGTKLANEKNLILVDTKYEFGKNKNGEIVLIDEIHTPDSSRYFIKDSYEEFQKNNKPQKQLSKEFVREWLMENGFEGKEGQVIPNITKDKINEISERYIELYEKITGNKFKKKKVESIDITLEKYFKDNVI